VTFGMLWGTDGLPDRPWWQQQEDQVNLYAVWYAAAGCLPDGDGPEFTGSLEECQDWVEANGGDYVRDTPHDLYSLSIEEMG